MNIDDDDDDDFDTKIVPSKLANLFSGETHSNDEVNRSLMYTPPKQPKKIDIPSNAVGSSSGANIKMTIIHAAAVTAYRYDNGKYIPQGKLGSALLGNHETCNYKLIFYTGKQQHITYATIVEKMQFICQPNMYSTFYDDNRQNWTVLFESPDAQCQFNKYMALCRSNSIGKSNDSKIVTQDLMVGDENGLTIEENDTIEVKFKGWIITERESIGKLFVDCDTNKKPLRLSLDKKVGLKWCEILLGMKIGGKRFVIIPFKFKEQFKEITENAYSDQILAYAFEFELSRIKPRKEISNVELPQSINKDIADSGDSGHSETKLTKDSRALSITASITAPEKNETQSKPSKSDILSRMAKLGMPILPKSDHLNPTPVNAKIESADTIDARYTQPEESFPMKPLPKPRNNSLTNVQTEETVPDSNNPQVNVSHNYTYTPSQVQYQMPSQFPQNFMPSNNVDPNLSVLVNETRITNTEVRMSLGKMMDKIDTVLDKVSDIRNSTSSNFNPMQQSSSIGFMDSAILLSTIQRIVNENVTLKKELDDKNLKLHSLNEKICDLLQHQSSNLNNNKNSEEIERLRLNESKLRYDLQLFNSDFDRLKNEKIELINRNSQLEERIKSLEFEISHLNQKKNDSESITQKEFISRVKNIMNNVYSTIVSSIEDVVTLSSDEVLQLVTNSIRNATMSALSLGSSDTPNTSTMSNPNIPPQSIDEIDEIEQKDNEICQNETDSHSDTSVINKSGKPPIPERKHDNVKIKVDNETN